MRENDRTNKGARDMKLKKHNDEFFNRLVAESNMTDQVHVNCEECGTKIPVGYARCADCEWVKCGAVTCDG